MKEIYREEKKFTCRLAGIFLLLLVLHVSAFMYVVYHTRPIFLIDRETDISLLSISFGDEEIVLNRKETSWYEQDTQYFADHDRIGKIDRFLKERPVQKINPVRDEERLFTLQVNERERIHLYQFIEEENRSIVEKDGQFYALPGNFPQLFSRRRDRYLSPTVIPPGFWEKVVSVHLWGETGNEFQRSEEGWKWLREGEEEGLVHEETLYELIMAPVIFHLDFTGLNLTKDYDMVLAKLFYQDDEELSLYYYYPRSGSGMTYIVLPQYEMTLGTREFASDYLALFSDQPL